jgi:hypothetical protein
VRSRCVTGAAVDQDARSKRRKKRSEFIGVCLMRMNPVSDQKLRRDVLCDVCYFCEEKSMVRWKGSTLSLIWWLP